MSASTILVADDEQALREFVARNLRARGFAVIEAGNGLEAMAEFNAQKIDLLIVDLMMPRMDGLEVVRRVREKVITPIIVLSALDADRDKLAAFDLGADDYLTKPFSVEELMARVRAVLRRAQVMPPPGNASSRIRKFGELEVDFDAHIVRRRGAEVRLTRTEFALLAELALHPNKVILQRALLQRVWGAEYGDESEYLRVYIGRLRRKIEDDPTTPRHLITEPGVGYRFAE
ncbi:MAG TPA: response regulator transcription factor [Thermoflexales bacterium]|nr:response regulator transcription factor [Thermoflexales bacterium]HQW36658.1 response regulator transcription factor [Thermoflexales bacterium]HQZ22209.1 response regulator transcription factor [Thermoflexales bacterium]